MRRRSFFFLAVIAACLGLCAYFVIVLTRRAPLRFDMPVPQVPFDAGRSTPTPGLFDSGKIPDSPPEYGAVLLIESGPTPRAKVIQPSGVPLWVSPGDSYWGGRVVSITRDAVVWENGSETRLLKPVK